MSHADRTVMEYRGYTVVTEIAGGLPTIYYFTKPITHHMMHGQG